jgi:hypothetical protein
VHGDLLPTLIVSAAGYSRHRRVVAERNAAGKLDLGELELHPGLEATTTVTDTKGLSQEHVRVELLSLAPVPPWMPWQVVARSDRSGALRFLEPLPAGRYSVTLLSPHILASPAVVELRPDQALAALVVQPGVLHMVEGIIVDPGGAPIRGFEVHGRATQLLATVETFTLCRWTAAIRVLDPSGKPLQGKPIVLDARPEIPWSGSATTDAEGVARFDSPPLVPLHAGFAGDRPFGKITPPGDLGSEVEHQFVLRLPRSAR